MKINGSNKDLLKVFDAHPLSKISKGHFVEGDRLTVRLGIYTYMVIDSDSNVCEVGDQTRTLISQNNMNRLASYLNFALEDSVDGAEVLRIMIGKIWLNSLYLIFERERLKV